MENDLLDTVIGLAPNLFYGTPIPACVLVLRAKGSKPAERQGKVLFINADAELREGRAQNTTRSARVASAARASSSRFMAVSPTSSDRPRAWDEAGVGRDARPLERGPGPCRPRQGAR